MRTFLLACLFLLFTCYGVIFAQNKTLGVGVTSPNPNAALHVESPTANQGFIMPRLTTLQRNAMTSLLTLSDNGLMLYDTDLNTIHIWNGLAWKTSAQVSGGPKLLLPYADTVATALSGNPNLLNLVYVGPSETAAVARFQNLNAKSKTPALWVESNSDSALSAPIYGLNTGTGDAAGVFRINNTASPVSALLAETNGSGPAIYGNQIGMGRGGQFQITNALNTNAAIRGFTSGTGYAGFYTINNPENTSAGIFSATNGGGPAFFGESTGSGSAGKFVVNNVNSGMPALWAETNSTQPLSAPIYGLNTGTGDAAGVFRINNPASTFPALVAESNGTGRAATFRKTNTTDEQPAVFVDSQGGHGIWADHNGPTGYAAIIQNINATNPNAAIFVEAVGSGQSLWAQKSQPTSTGDAIFGEHLGSAGSAARFVINNAANPSPGIMSQTNGTGAAITAENTGAGNGFAGVFNVTNATNNYPAIQASSAGAASGVRVIQTTGTGGGVDVFMQNASSSAPGMAVDQGGLGTAGSFLITNTTSGSPAVNAITNGAGAALEAKTSSGFTAVYGRHEGTGNGNAGLFEITGTSNAYPALQVNTAGTGYAINARHTGTLGDAIYAEHAGAASGSAGNFRISNPANTASSLFAATTASGGTAIGATNDANGIAFAIWGGGIKITTHDVTTASITTRASAYRILGGGTTFTLDFGPSPGEVFMMINETGQNITIAGITMVNGEGKTFVVFPGGIIRGF